MSPCPSTTCLLMMLMPRPSKRVRKKVSCLKLLRELDCLPSEQAPECKEPEQEARVHVSQVEQAADYKQPEQCTPPNTRVQRREEHAHLVRWLGLGLGG